METPNPNASLRRELHDYAVKRYEELRVDERYRPLYELGKIVGNLAIVIGLNRIDALSAFMSGASDALKEEDGV